MEMRDAYAYVIGAAVLERVHRACGPVGMLIASSRKWEPAIQ